MSGSAKSAAESVRLALVAGLAAQPALTGVEGLTLGTVAVTEDVSQPYTLYSAAARAADLAAGHGAVVFTVAQIGASLLSTPAVISVPTD